MADDFRKSAIKGTYNINTEVIIQKNIEKRILKEENIANILPSISIALGLIGTIFRAYCGNYDNNRYIIFWNTEHG